MSNLSELLPTGGGQNAVNFVAAENISAGQAVALKTDGRIEAADSGNLENVIGLAAEAITSGNTGEVNVFGGINEAQSGLTIGANYYVNSSGSLTTSNTEPYVALGQAISATTINLRDSNLNNYVFPIQGQAAYTTSGTYSWVAPEEVTSISVVAIGGGWQDTGYGRGGGGGLGWKNNISVIPGQSYTVFVSPRGSDSVSAETSYFINAATVSGQAGSSGAGGSYVGDGGGFGGFAGGFYGAGGGAGGYSGNGGNAAPSEGNGSAGSGGGGGGGGQGNAFGITQGATGGGTGILGEGASGSGGSGGSTSPSGGGGGSGGTAGTWSQYGTGGLYGGGGAHYFTPSYDYVRLNGGRGAVRIIWGPNRAFPSTNTGDV